MKRIAAIALSIGAAVVGCKRTDRDGFDRPGDPEPIWSATATSVLEGGKTTLTLSRGSERDDEQVMELASSDTTRATVPATVTFPEGAASVPVTITTIADADNADSLVTITATASGKTDAVHVTLVEDDVAIGNAHGPVVFGPGTLLLVRPGTDGLFQTSDDVLSVVEDLGSTTLNPVITDVVIGAVTPGPHALPVVTGVSDSVLVVTNGADLTLGTPDDAVVEVGDILTAPAVTSSVAVGRMDSSERNRPVMVGTRAVLGSRGADGLTSADDELVVVAGIDTGTLTVSTVSTPGLAFEEPSIPVVLDADTVLLRGTGGDNIAGSGSDDTFSIVTGFAGVPVVSTPLFGPFAGDRVGMPTVVGPTTAVMAGVGADLALGTPDDILVVAQGLPAAPVFAFPPVGALSLDATQGSVATGGDAVLLPGRGADLTDGTADDEALLLTSLSGVPAGPTILAAGSPPAGANGRFVSLSSGNAARLTTGADGLPGTTDDGVVLLTSLTGVAASGTFATGAWAFRPLRTSDTSFALVGEGVDATAGTPDDRTIEVTGVGTSPLLNFNLTGSFNLSGDPVLLTTAGEPVVAARTRGDDDAASTSDDILGIAVVP